MWLRTLVSLGLLGLAPAASASGRAPRIVIDPGHGGSKTGALGAGEQLEKGLVLQIALQLRDRLEEETGAQVFLTREKDALVQLPDRVTFANGKRPDLFMSIHANSMPTRKLRERVEGIETYFLSAAASGAGARATADRENADAPRAQSVQNDSTLNFILNDLVRMDAHAGSSRLAYAIHQRLIASTGASDRGVLQAPFFVLTGVEAPAVLIEVGYISHPQEGARLARAEYQEKLVSAIASGVKDFLKDLSKRDAPSGADSETPQVASPTSP
ncbi:N-acetylmuramoyl-L-alanine amidase family protein [Stigmatella aurantiaca]|uniref:N-acetylmuramoyl-L-alanine amidase n=1 Tax=Stigmatella aurantiaca (strain DW4/3-1) TaxID=378806 RepID=Q08VK1_STIAD|nr:N-acetylmuramoyl-L-alanine amidase [Stigmatella aurantiaca]ADO70617.1 N-acetylmuramoyl-L-alanine amidase [Stigmatella aurantiaca DW4/3-1]EAU64494.1 N-acetylmuramoyl-L-alanine amidase [Stigmatella aurantiaca DW4/3-1]